MNGDVLALGPEHAGRYDLVCCHGVAMYPPSLEETVAALCEACCLGGMVSLLTRNRAGIAMRAGMTGDRAGALEAFDGRHYKNPLVDRVRPRRRARGGAGSSTMPAAPFAIPSSRSWTILPMRQMSGHGWPEFRRRYRPTSEWPTRSRPPARRG